MPRIRLHRQSWRRWRLTAAPQGYDDTADHIATFFQAVETREHVVEDEVFGNNAAIACHMANHSYFNHEHCHVGCGSTKHQGLIEP